jgi:hypothetical protein
MSCLKQNFDQIDFDVNCAVSTSKVPARHRSLLTLAGTHHTRPTMSATACPIAIKVPVHSGYRRSKLPPVAARLQAREKPERKAVSDEVRDAFGFSSRRANV